jgi:ABC-type Fe3+ transport system permease subunit
MAFPAFFAQTAGKIAQPAARSRIVSPAALVFLHCVGKFYRRYLGFSRGDD